LYWNIYKWKIAVSALKFYDIYGCNGATWERRLHYSGNFWWATRNYIKTLPDTIDDHYSEAEFWICLNHPRMCDIYTNRLAGGLNYTNRLSSKEYEIHEKFDIDVYKYSHDDLLHLKYSELISHYLVYGKNENRRVC
jgi:hypothetical protein